MIDVIPLLFYGIICTLLAILLPPSLQLWARSAIGAAVGIGGAASLPVLRATLGI